MGGDQPIGHFTIFPTKRMTAEEFANKLRYLQYTGDTVNVRNGSGTETIGWTKGGRKK